jgi:23S rRNA (uracil1939-C5)-methyltransferase
MSLFEGQLVELSIEKPASGGRMIARHQGQIVLVRGAIPGERVRALVERAEKRLAYAATKEIVDASPDRRPDGGDPLCGGALYSHIAYPRQLALKSDVIRDAFARVGRHPIERAVDVAASPEAGYRMRARLHVHGDRAGFYREGTHQLCEAAATRQLRSAAVDAVSALTTVLDRSARGAATSIAIAENLAGDERAAHLELAPGSAVTGPLLEAAAQDSGLRGISARNPTTGQLLVAGEPVVFEPLAAITSHRAHHGTLRRRAEAFFQGNRFLVPALVAAVIDLVPDDGDILDLYAGVGLFSVALAAVGRLEVTGVEGDHAGGADFLENARAQAPRLTAHVTSVEAYLAEAQGTAATVIVDPPRTGMSPTALSSLVRLKPARLVYVSCDPPTLARDARRLIDGGYTLASLRAFDFFPNTPHVESLALFVRAGGLDERGKQS